MSDKFKFLSTNRYLYHCNKCGNNLICYQDERLEKEERPVPFFMTCPYCLNMNMCDTGFIHLIERVEINEFNKNVNKNNAIFLLLDEDIKKYGDMACGCLHIRKNNKMVSTFQELLDKNNGGVNQ